MYKSCNFIQSEIQINKQEQVIQFKYQKMQQIKHQIFSHITNNHIKHYLQENIFKDSIPTKRECINIDSSIRRDSRNVRNGSNQSVMKVSSSLKNNQKMNSKLSIKSLIKKIEWLVVVDGFWKNIENINTLKNKTESLKRQNKKMEIKLAEQKLKSTTRLSQTNQRLMSLAISNDNKIVDQSSQIDDHIHFDEHIKQSSQKLSYEKTKQQLISIVKLSKEQKSLLLTNTRKQYESMLRHIRTIEKVIENIEMFHPHEAGLKLELQQLESELTEKSMILKADEKLDVEIELLEKQIKMIQNKPDIVNNDNTQSKVKQISSNHHQEKLSNLAKKLSQFQQFLKQQQKEKHQLVKQIKQFNQLFNKEKDMNRELFNKIKENFYQYPALIDQIIKLGSQDKSKVKFLLKQLGLDFL